MLVQCCPQIPSAPDEKGSSGSSSRNARTLLEICVGITIAFIIGTAILSRIQLNKVQHAKDRLEIVADCDLTNQELLNAILKAETGERGFVITGDARYFKCCSEDQDQENVWEKYHKLVRQVEEINPPQVRNELDKLKNHITTKLTELNHVASVRNRSGFESARAMVQTHVGRDLMIRIETTLRMIEREVHDILDRERAELQTMIKALEAITYCSLTLIGCTLLCGMGLFCTNDRKARARRYNEIEDLLAKAESATKVKAAFVSTVSHELRTPMTGLSSVVDLLINTPLSEEQTELVGIMNASLQIITRLINDILLFSKVVDFHRFLTSLLEPVAIQMRAKELVFEVEIDKRLPRGIFMDSDRFGQVLINLLHNSIKFSHRHGTIRLAVCKVNPTENFRLPESPNLRPSPDSMLGVVGIEISVTDAGIGVPKDLQEVIFQPFRKADPSQTRLYGGTGLGLTISRQLVQMMGGDITVESKPGNGSRFKFAITVPVVHLGRVSVSELSLFPHPGVGSEPERKLPSIDTCRQAAAYASTPGSSPPHRSPGSTASTRSDHTIEVADPAFHHRFHSAPLPAQPASVRPMHDKLTSSRAMVNLNTASPQPTQPTSAETTSFIEANPAAESSAATGPLPTALPPVVPPDVSSAAVPGPLHVLLVEDSDIVQKVMAKMCRQLGYKCSIVTNGRDALEAIVHSPLQFDVVLMDVHMPIMDGLTATRLIREHEECIGSAVTKAKEILSQDSTKTAAQAIANQSSKPNSSQEPAPTCGTCSAGPKSSSAGSTTSGPSHGVCSSVSSRTPVGCPHELRLSDRETWLTAAASTAANPTNSKEHPQLMAVLQEPNAHGSAPFTVHASTPTPPSTPPNATKPAASDDKTGGSALCDDASMRWRTPVIALTAGASEEEQTACLRAGMDAIVTKPVRLVDLKTKLSAIPRKTKPLLS